MPIYLASLVKYNFWLIQSWINKNIRKILFIPLLLCISHINASESTQNELASLQNNITYESQAVILMYHHFGNANHPSTNIRLQQFDLQLEHLAQAGYQVWPLEQIVDYITSNKPFPSRVVAITVDDAYQSVYAEAYPRLKARGWPFTVFVATDGVDAHFRAYMNWDQMREMQQHGVTFANHSASHDYLVRRLINETEGQWQTRIQDDISRAQHRLKQELGSAPNLFAYPYGEYDTSLAAIVSGLGLVAFGQQSGPVGLRANHQALPRFPMAERFAEIKDFRQKIASLAFPIDKVTPWDPVWSGDTAPVMTIKLGKSDARLDQLSCFISGQGQVPVKWLNRKARQFTVQAPAPLPKGRSRYNCTAPSSQKERFYWYSHLWIRP